jgi:putative ABC transport system ATP-binding protein
MTDAASAGSATGLRARLAAQAIDLTRIYGSGITAVMALDSVSVDFPMGQFTAVLGPSGAGKSTLLQCLAGLDRPDSGVVLIGGVNITSLKESALTRLQRDRVGFVFQSFSLLPMLSAAENIELPLRLAGRSPDRVWIDRVIDAVGLRSRLDHRAAELSGGEQQRVAAARALAGRPDIIFADEPTGNLDSRSGDELLGFLKRTVDEFDQTIVMVTDAANAARYADRALFLIDGRIVDEIIAPTGRLLHDRLRSLRV